MRKIEGVIFDMDGLLFDTERVSYSFWKDILKKYGYIMDNEVYTSSLMGRTHKASNKKLIKKYGEDFPILKIRAERNKCMLEFIQDNGVPVKSGVYELLDFLVAKKYKVALATSTARERTINLLEMANIRNKFTSITCGDDVINSKPNPEIFLKAAEKLEVDPKKCIVLEDSPAGIEAAYNAGMMPINVPDLKDLDDKTKSLAYVICGSLLEVKDYLRKFDLE